MLGWQNIGRLGSPGGEWEKLLYKVVPQSQLHTKINRKILKIPLPGPASRDWFTSLGIFLKSPSRWFSCAVEAENHWAKDDNFFQVKGSFCKIIKTILTVAKGNYLKGKKTYMILPLLHSKYSQGFVHIQTCFCTTVLIVVMQFTFTFLFIIYYKLLAYVPT